MTNSRAGSVYSESCEHPSEQTVLVCCTDALAVAFCCYVLA
jgi:hypothetical protein